MEVDKMAKLPHPYSYYFKSMIDGKCPFCHGGDIYTTDNKDVIWCDGYDNGTYVAAETCELFASEGQCNNCSEWEFVHRHYPNDLVMVCERCKIAINFGTQKVSKTLF
jgi:hypothetical protein